VLVVVVFVPGVVVFPLLFALLPPFDDGMHYVHIFRERFQVYVFKLNEGQLDCANSVGSVALHFPSLP